MRHAIAAEVRAEAARHQMSQAGVALVLSTSTATVSRKFKGAYPFDADELLALAQAWDVPVTRLLPAGPPSSP